MSNLTQIHNNIFLVANFLFSFWAVLRALLPGAQGSLLCGARDQTLIGHIESNSLFIICCTISLVAISLLLKIKLRMPHRQICILPPSHMYFTTKSQVASSLWVKPTVFRTYSWQGLGRPYVVCAQNKHLICYSIYLPCLLFK